MANHPKVETVLSLLLPMFTNKCRPRWRRSVSYSSPPSRCATRYFAQNYTAHSGDTKGHVTLFAPRKCRPDCSILTRKGVCGENLNFWVLCYQSAQSVLSPSPFDARHVTHPSCKSQLHSTPAHSPHRSFLSLSTNMRRLQDLIQEGNN